METLHIQDELIAFIIQDLPESIILTLSMFSLLALPLTWRKIIAIGFLQALVNMVRLLPIVAGIHSIILLISLAVFVGLFTRVRLSKVFVAAFVIFGIVIILEMIYVGPLLRITGLTYEASFVNPFFRALFSLPYEIVLLAIAVGMNYYNRRKGRMAA
jgi:hypothetical protein